MVVISKYSCDEFNAGPKAKVDIEEILNENVSIHLETLKFNTKVLKNKIGKLILCFRQLIFALKVSKINEEKIIQLPFRKIDFFLRNNKNIFIIHDIEGLRYNNLNILKQEINQYRKADYLIVHNDKMKEYLIKKGIDKNKIKVLDVFDYLVKNNDEIIKKNNLKNIQVVYAGNLVKEKSPFLHQIDKEKINFNFNLYGVGVSNDINEKMKYKGSFEPDILPNKLEGDLGLVWDGNYDESDENNGFKNYTKYNNPHKLSCYIAAGLPVIVWRKAAISDLVKKYNIGYTISNIYDINNINFSDYNEKLKNIQDLSKKVRSGYFTKRVMKEIFNDMGVNENEI